MQNEATAALPTPDYAANPEALANMTDEQLDALANAAPEPEANPPAAEVDAGDKAGSETPPAASDQKAEGSEPKGVQAKDGAHVIPYSVLERERDRAFRAEQTASALSEQLQKLQAGDVSSSSADANVGKLTEEDLSLLDQDLPGVAKVIRAQMAVIAQLNGAVSTLYREQEAQAQAKQSSAQDEIESAISGNSDLSAWREAANKQEGADPAMWDRAVNLDVALRNDPYWADRPMAERFSKVAETVKSLYGAPPAAKPNVAATQSDSTLIAKADAALAAASQSVASAPRSLGDIPGGSAPLVDETASLMSKSGAELTNDFMAMTPEQIEAKLNRLR